MKKSFDDYELLLNGGSRGSLWLGKDHLLVVEAMSFLVTYSENYRRLDYDCIQAILTAKNKRLMFALWFLGIALVGNLILAIIIYTNDAQTSYPVFAFCLLWIVFIVYQIAKGATMSMIIKTAVRPWKIAPVRRKRHAIKVRNALLERCAQAQGGVLEPGVLANNTQAVLAAASGSAVNPTGAAPPLLVQDVDHQTLRPHVSTIWGYSLLALLGVMSIGEVHLDSMPYSIGMLTVGFASMILLFASISRKGGIVRTGGKGIWFISVGTLAVYGVLLYIFGIAFMVKNPQDTFQFLSFFEELAKFPTDLPPEVGYGIYGMGGAMVLFSFLGILAYQRRMAQLSE